MVETLDPIPQKSGRRGERLKDKNKNKKRKLAREGEDGFDGVDQDSITIKNGARFSRKKISEDATDKEGSVLGGEDEISEKETVKPVVINKNTDDGARDGEEISSTGGLNSEGSDIIPRPKRKSISKRMIDEAINNKDFAHKLMEREMNAWQGDGSKAVRDKDFAQGLAEHKLKEGDIDTKKEIARSIKELKEELKLFIEEFNKKLKNFRETYPDDVEFKNKISQIINKYEEKIGTFDVINEYDRETLTRINQLHYEMQEWTMADWIKLYKIKELKNKKESGPILQELDNNDLHGDGSLVVKHIEAAEQNEKIAKLEKECGEIGASYVRYDKGGFPVDSFTIIRYELGENNANTFVIVDKLVDGENSEIKIDLKKFKKDNKRYQKVMEGVITSNSDEKTEAIEENLSAEEKNEMISLINEKLADVESDYNHLMKRFHDFREKNKDEIKYHKIIFKKTLDVQEKKVALRKVVKGGIQVSQKILNNLMDLDREIITLIEAAWDDELREFKGEIEFTENEKIIIEKSKEIANKFIEDSRTKFNWDNFPKGRIDMLLETQAVAFLMKEFKKRKLFIKNEEKVAEIILKERK